MIAKIAYIIQYTIEMFDIYDYYQWFDGLWIFELNMLIAISFAISLLYRQYKHDVDKEVMNLHQ